MKSRAIAATLLALVIGVSGCAPSGEPAGVETSGTPMPMPTPTATLTPTPPSIRGLAAVQAALTPVREQAAMVVMGTIGGSDAASLAEYVASGPRGLILMGGNVPGAPEGLRALTDEVHAASADALIAIDQEGGDVKRMPWDDLPSARQLKDEDVAQARTAFTDRARLLADAGVDVNFGVVADVPRSDGSFIFRRSYGTDPQSVADRVAAIVGSEDGLVASTLKHFPGHGAAEGDSHSAIPTTGMSLAEWRSFDAVPFQAGIDAGAELVMMGHLRFTAVSDLPASLSPEWYGILRDELGFEGVAVTDDLGMLSSSGEAAYADPVENAVAAIAAGADLVLMIAGSTPETAGRIIDALAARAADDGVFAERLAEAAARVIVLSWARDRG
ncbi:glycoside hydrolase family 3 N-terminal domain-containing protein [Microbacterium tumbae]